MANLNQRVEGLFEVPLANVPAKEWTQCFENAATSDDALAIAEYLCSTKLQLKLSPAARAKILGAAAAMAMDLCLVGRAVQLAEAYLKSGKTSAKVKRVLEKRQLTLVNECNKAEATIAAISQGDGAAVDEAGWLTWVRHCTRRTDLTPIATNPATGAFLAFRTGRTIKDSDYFQTSVGSSEMIVYFDGDSLQPTPFAYQFEGTLKGEYKFDTSQLVEEGQVTDEALWMKKKETFRHIQRFGTNVRFYATYNGGGFSSDQEIQHRFWILCETKAEADAIMEMAHASSWLGEPVVENHVGTNLVFEKYYGPSAGHLARIGCVVVDDDWERAGADNKEEEREEGTFERERLVDFLQAFRKKMKEPYPLIEEYMASEWATDPGGLSWVRRYPSEDAALAYYQAKRLKYWKRGSRLWSYMTFPLT